MIDHYDWAGGREAMIRFGPSKGPVVIAAMPLFEEANRTRALVVMILRALAERGIGSALPDLPGVGESLIETENASLTIWKEAFSAAVSSLANQRVHTIAIRGGALVDQDAMPTRRWHFAPVTGASLVRDLLRTRLVVEGEGAEPFDTSDPDGPAIELAGNLVSRHLLAELENATPSTVTPVRIVRLETDAGAADLKIPGAPLWRRSEPDNDPDLAIRLADDIAAWIASCAD